MWVEKRIGQSLDEAQSGGQERVVCLWVKGKYDVASRVPQITGVSCA